MGSPTSDDDPTRRVPGPGGWGQGGGYPPPDDPTTRFPQADSQRGQTAPFPGVGGYPQAGAGSYPQGPAGPYPPPGPGGPYPPQGPGGPYPPPGASGYGGPPPGGGRGNRGLAIALGVALLALVGLAVALIFAFTRDDGESAAADPSTSTSDSPAPTSSSSPSPTGSTSSSPTSPSGTAGDRTDELLATVPPDFTDCEPTTPAGDGDVAAVTCGPSTTQPGPQTAFFYLYEDSATLDQVFATDAEGIDPMPAGEDCATAQGVTTWNVDGVEGGEIACTLTEEGLLIAWTDREFGIEGVVTARGTTQAELSALAEWWRSNSDYQG